MTVVKARLGSGLRVEITSRHFTFLADEPPSVGGGDQGPSPYELLAGSLAACTATTLRLYADHKGIALDGVDIEVEFDRVHATDCLECEAAEGGLIERLRTQIRLHGSFDEAQKKRLVQVAQRCPVHKTLAKGVQIFDSISFSG